MEEEMEEEEGEESEDEDEEDENGGKDMFVLFFKLDNVSRTESKEDILLLSSDSLSDSSSTISSLKYLT